MRNNALLIVFSLMPLAVLAQAPLPLPSPMMPTPSMPAPMGMPGMPGVSTEAPLKYRNSSGPLTIGEMSALQAKKLETDFLRKLGFTNTAPIAAPSMKVQPSAKQAAVPAAAPPKTAILALGIYGPDRALMTDLSIKGVVRSVRAGEQLPGGVTVVAVTPKTVELSVVSGRVATSHTLSVGRVLELAL